MKLDISRALPLKHVQFALITLGLMLICSTPTLSLAGSSLSSKITKSGAKIPFPEPYLYGKAVLAHGAALSGATIFVLNSKGYDITDLVLAPADPDFCKPRGRRCTSESGSFAFKVIDKFPTKFRIVARGGTVRGQKSKLTLEQLVDDSSSLKYGANLTIGSTVFSKLVTKGLSPDVALTRTRKVLNLPIWANLGPHLHHSSVHLSGVSLTEAAPRHGGLSFAMRQLVSSARWERHHAWIIDSAPIKSKAAPPAPSLELSSIPEWATNILKGIPGSIVGSIVGAGVDWVIGAIGLNPTANSLGRIEADLSGVSTQLTSIKSAINDLFADVNANYTSLKLLEQCNNDRQTANVYWNSVQGISDEIVSYTEWMQQLTDYGNGKESLATAITAWNHLNSTGDDLSSGKGINSLINALTGLNSPPGQKGFISNVVAAFGPCTQQQGKVFLNAGERAAYASTFNWGMALMLTASMIQSNYNYAGTWKCIVAPQGTSGGANSLFCPAGMLAFPSDVAAGTNAPTPTPADIYYAFNNAYPQIMPSGVSADLRSGLLWTRTPVSPRVMIDSTGLVENIRDYSINTTSTEIPINSITQWKVPSVSVAQALINSVPSGTLPADWLNKNTQAVAGESAFDSVASNLSSRGLFSDSVLGSPSSTRLEPLNTSDLLAPWGKLVGLINQSPNSYSPSYIAYLLDKYYNTRAYGIITLEDVATHQCPATQAMFGNINDPMNQSDAYCTDSPVPGNTYYALSAKLTPATVKDSYKLVMLDQTAFSFNSSWMNGFPPESSATLTSCNNQCIFGGYHTLVLRDTVSSYSSDTNNVIVYGFGIPKDYPGHYMTALVHDQSKDKVLSVDIINQDGSVENTFHAPSFTTIPDDWALNTTH